MRTHVRSLAHESQLCADRELGILGHLPAFGGYAPWALAEKNNQTKPGSGATRGKRGHDYDTAWIDGRTQHDNET